jgi:hypothetical protein
MNALASVVRAAEPLVFPSVTLRPLPSLIPAPRETRAVAAA